MSKATAGRLCVNDLELAQHRLLDAEEHLRLALPRITRLEEAIACAKHARRPTANSRVSLRALYDSVEVMLLYRDHTAARYEKTLLMFKLSEGNEQGSGSAARTR